MIAKCVKVIRVSFDSLVRTRSSEFDYHLLTMVLGRGCFDVRVEGAFGYGENVFQVQVIPGLSLCADFSSVVVCWSLLSDRS